MKPGGFNMDSSSFFGGLDSTKKSSGSDLFGGTKDPFGKRDPFGKSDLDYLFSENIFKGTTRKKSRFNLQPQPKTPPVNRRNTGVVDKSSIFSSPVPVNRTVVSPQRNPMVQEPMKQHNIQPPAMTRPVVHPHMYRNVNTNPHEYHTQQYDEIERDRASLIATLKREWGSQVDEENKAMLYKWIQEYQNITREEFAKRSREASETKPLYWSIFNTYYCDRLKILQKEKASIRGELEYERRLKNEISADSGKRISALKKENDKLTEDLKKTRKELSLAKKEVTTLEKTHEEEKKNFQNDLTNAWNSKRTMMSSFRDLLAKKEVSHMKKVKEKKDNTFKGLHEWAERFKKDRENLPGKLNSFREILMKIAEIEKKVNTIFSARVTAIMEQHEQRVLNSVKDKIFDKLLKDFEVEKVEVEVETEQ